MSNQITSELIMFSTDDHNYHNKVVLLKRNNPNHSEAAELMFQKLAETHETYHGAVLFEDEDEAFNLIEKCGDKGISLAWV